MTTLFISDLHLDPDAPEITSQCLEFLADEAAGAEALYILGDLFEAWVGDDDPEPEKRRVIEALHALAEGGLPIAFMRGNRDFLVGERFAADAGCRLLDDPTVVDLYEQPVILMHGDSLCTDDLEYQAFRNVSRQPDWQAEVLAKPLEVRLAMARQARAQSREHTSQAAGEIMDVNQGAVEDAMRRHGVYTLLHGHTHRPDVHRFEVDGHEATRIVLGDWYTQGSVVRWSEHGYELVALPR